MMDAPGRPLKFLVYASSATRLFGHEELVDLLRKCRRNNERAGITGMLLYDRGNFMQLIEGPEDAVDRLFARISADRRHKQVTLMLEGPLEEREFESWSMGFVNGDDLTPEDRAAYSDFLREPFDRVRFGDNPHRAVKLLRSFREMARRS